MAHDRQTGEAMQHNRDKTTALKQSAGLPVIALATLMAETKAAFPNQSITEETATVFLRDWNKLAREWGAEEFKAVLEEARHSLRFFPLIADLHDIHGKRAQRRMYEPRHEKCWLESCEMRVVPGTGVYGFCSTQCKQQWIAENGEPETISVAEIAKKIPTPDPVHAAKVREQCEKLKREAK